MDTKEAMKKYLEIDKKVKELKEEQEMYRETIQLNLQESSEDRFYDEELGQAKITITKAHKRVNSKLAKENLTEEQLESIMKETPERTGLKIQSIEALKAMKNYLENKNGK